MSNVVTKEIVTCAEMARLCGLSRSRFYMLVREGIMPPPSRNPDTRRPFYTREQQEQCLLVRRTHCGINGKPILFYAQRAQPVAARPSQIPVGTATRRTRQPQRTDPVVLELQHGLEQLGIVDVTESRIRAALSHAYPDGHGSISPAQRLMTVFRRLREEVNENA